MRLHHCFSLLQGSNSNSACYRISCLCSCLYAGTSTYPCPCLLRTHAHTPLTPKITHCSTWPHSMPPAHRPLPTTRCLAYLDAEHCVRACLVHRTHLVPTRACAFLVLHCIYLHFSYRNIKEIYMDRSVIRIDDLDHHLHDDSSDVSLT